MPAFGTPLNLGAAKATVLRRIAAQRAEIVAAGRLAVRPLVLLDDGVALWRGLPPLVRAMVLATGVGAARRFRRNTGGRTGWTRLLPLLIGLLGRDHALRH